MTRKTLIDAILGIMETKMETTTMGYIRSILGITEKKLKTTIRVCVGDGI